MWVDPRVPKVVNIACPKCLSNFLDMGKLMKCQKCSSCFEYRHLLTCSGLECDFKIEICMKCEVSKHPMQENKLHSKPDNEKNTLLFIIIGAIIVLIAISVWHFKSSPDLEDLQSLEEVRRLKQQFPSQKNETWYHILSALEQKVPTVKSITLLYKNNRKTTDCLARKLVQIFDKNVKLREVSFDLNGTQYRDYGEVFELYHSIVKKFRVLVTDLSNMPGNMARAFHSLCDEVSSDIKPSLFIFTLQYDEVTGNLKPLEKATGILKQTWSDLPDSDIFPLLSRIIKNVVDVEPEKQAAC